MAFEMKKDESAATGSKRYRFELSFGGLLGLGAVLVVGMVWVFIFGVLVGRGYQPEQQVPELATLMPASQGATAQMAKEEKEDENKVIPPEELDYYANLKEEGRAKKTAAPAPAAAKVSAASEKKEAEAAAAKPAPPAKELKTIVPASPKTTVAMTAANNTPEKKAAPSTKPPQKRQPESTAAQSRPKAPATSAEADDEDTDTQIYDYVYQIASLQDPNAAKRFRDKVSKLGLTVEVSVVRAQSKIWHRVVVHFRGMPKDTREMKRKLQEVGVEKPLMKSKKPM